MKIDDNCTGKIGCRTQKCICNCAQHWEGIAAKLNLCFLNLTPFAVTYSMICVLTHELFNSCKKGHFIIVCLIKGLSLCIMCFDQHVKYRIPHGFSLFRSLLLDYHV